MNHSLALRRDGTVVAWGCRNGADWGQCTVPTDLSDVVAIAAGTESSLALRHDGTVVAWGCRLNDFGQCTVPTGLSSVTAIAAGDVHGLALSSPTCKVPKVVGKRLAAAKRTIAKRHCSTGKVRSMYSRTRKRGIVISQSRRPGRIVSAGSKINLVVSRGPRPRR
jgi:hypothetical protein